MRALPSSRAQFPEPIGDAAGLGRYAPWAGSGVWLRAPRRAIVGSVLVLAGAAIVLFARIALSGGAAVGGAPIVAETTFNGVGYGLLSATVGKTLSQRGGRAVSASGVFDVVKLKLHAVDGKPHVIAGSLVSLDARGTYYGVSSPTDIGLTDRQWGVLWGPMTVPAHGSVNVKAIFDVPPAVVRRRLSIHIGAFNYTGEARPAILKLPSRTPCCRSASVPAIESIGPSPVLG
jgi:hypothetical protein